MGYTAEQAGMVLSPGGLVVILLLPLVGQLLARVDARWLIAFGFATTAVVAVLHDRHLIPASTSATAVKYRMYPVGGAGVPVRAHHHQLVYVGVPPDKNNQVSALTNLVRNIGGGIGISVAQTLLARRTQFHQQHLVSHVTAWSPELRHLVGGLRGALVHAGIASSEATRRAYAMVYGMVMQQATTLAFIDVLWLLAIGSGILTPLAFLMRRPKRGAAMMH